MFARHAQHENALTHGLSQEVNAAVLKSLPFLSTAEAQAFVGVKEAKRREILERAIAEIIGKRSQIDDAAVRSWAWFYEKYFPAQFSDAGGLDALLQLSPPEERKGFDRIIVVLKGVTATEAILECRKCFPCWECPSFLEGGTTHDDRTSNASYLIRIRGRIEPDEEWADVSAADLAGRKAKSITLLERILLELKFFEETKRHLDIEKWTLCAGSRMRGVVPYAGWREGQFRVPGTDERSSTYLCSREVIGS